MAINVTDVFKITDIPRTNRCDWSVTWPTYGRVSKPENQARLLKIAFETAPDHFGIALENGNVHWLNSSVYYSGNLTPEELIGYLNFTSSIVGFAFPERRDAEVFVDGAEKMILMNLLTRDYHD